VCLCFFFAQSVLLFVVSTLTNEYEPADWAKQGADPKWLQDALEADEAAAAAKEAAKQDLYCPVCKKKFKSQKQWENHEQSKQHKVGLTVCLRSLRGYRKESFCFLRHFGTIYSRLGGTFNSKI
jgi:hypothetical protein